MENGNDFLHTKQVCIVSCVNVGQLSEVVIDMILNHPTEPPLHNNWKIHSQGLSANLQNLKYCKVVTFIHGAAKKKFLGNDLIS